MNFLFMSPGQSRGSFLFAVNAKPKVEVNQFTPRMIKIERSEVERHRSAWEDVARKNKWLDTFVKRNRAIQLFVDMRARRIADSIYLCCGDENSCDVFSNRMGTRRLEEGKDFELT
jgi:hypothetical protein